MLLMIEEAVRGGITQVITKFSEASNKYIQNYDQTKYTSFEQFVCMGNVSKTSNEKL